MKSFKDSTPDLSDLTFQILEIFTGSSRILVLKRSISCNTMKNVNGYTFKIKRYANFH